MSGNVSAIILVAGPQKGTRFRPLSLEVPKPLFPVAGYPLLEHHIASCAKVPEIKDIILLGYYQSNEQISRFIEEMQRKYKIFVRYMQEYRPLGTAGGLYHFRDQVMIGGCEAIFVIHADVFCITPIKELLEYHKKMNEGEDRKHVVLGTMAPPSQTSEHGNMVVNENTNEVTHYVEKPESFVSTLINCGVYVFHPSVFETLGDIYQTQVQMARDDPEFLTSTSPEEMYVGRHLFNKLAGSQKVYCHMHKGFWGSMKSAGAAVFANQQFLSTYRNDSDHAHTLASNGPSKPEIVGDVFIHPTATVDPSAKIGPNVSIGQHCVIGEGARVKESIILDGAELKEHCCVLDSIVGWRCLVGAWSRVEGTSIVPNPNFPHALVPNESLFHADGKLIPSITVLGCNVIIPRETMILNCIVLPHKELQQSYKNQIIL